MMETEILVFENATDWHAVLGHLLELAENLGDFFDIVGTQFLALAAETFPHLLPEAAGRWSNRSRAGNP
jgi:hypothetical protein